MGLMGTCDSFDYTLLCFGKSPCVALSPTSRRCRRGGLPDVGLVDIFILWMVVRSSVSSPPAFHTLCNVVFLAPSPRCISLMDIASRRRVFGCLTKGRAILGFTFYFSNLRIHTVL